MDNHACIVCVVVDIVRHLSFIFFPPVRQDYSVWCCVPCSSVSSFLFPPIVISFIIYFMVGFCAFSLSR